MPTPSLWQHGGPERVPDHARQARSAHGDIFFCAAPFVTDYLALIAAKAPAMLATYYPMVRPFCAWLTAYPGSR